MNIINDNDINEYLSMIKKKGSSNAGSTVSNPPTRTTPSGRVFIDPTCDVRGIERMRFGKNVVIQKDCWLNIAFNNPSEGPMIVINEGTDIGRRCTLSAANKIFIGKFVLIAPNVFIADTHHEYQKIGIPIMYQGITTHNDQITIK
jgi:acetyltransferase-like isoleucine patch superfamily enzyme